MLYIDKELLEIYDNALEILKTNEKELLKYSNYNTLNEAMYKLDKVKINNRTQPRRGQYLKSKNTIEISSYMLFYPKNEILTTMVHELLHTFKDSNGHKGNWKLRANILSKLTGLNIVRVRDIKCEAEIIRNNERLYKLIDKTKYQCRCKKCGTVVTYYKYTRFIKHPELYTHKKCGGNFERKYEV